MDNFNWQIGLWCVMIRLKQEKGHFMIKNHLGQLRNEMKHLTQ